MVTGAGRAFCAGMDLSADGNVFGLDESLRPAAAEFRAAYDEAPYDRRRPRHRRQGDAGDPRAAEAGDRRDQRPGGRDRRDDDARDGPPAGLDQGPDRLRVRPARHRAGGRVDVVPAAHRRRPAGAGVGLLRRDPRPPTPRSPAGWSAASTSPTTWCRPPRTWPGRSSSTAPPSRSGWPSGCVYRNSAAADPLEAHLSDSLAMYWSVARRRQGGRGGLPREAPAGLHRPRLRAAGDLLGTSPHSAPSRAGFRADLARRRCEGGTESRRVADNAARSDAKVRAAGAPNGVSCL